MGYIVCLNKLMSHILCANKHIGYVILATAGGLLAFPGSDSDTRSVSVITCKKGDITEIYVHGLD
jgi:hypothetical protein